MSAKPFPAMLDQVFSMYGALIAPMKRELNNHADQIMLTYLTSNDAAQNVGVQFLLADWLSPRWPLHTVEDTMLGCWLRTRFQDLNRKLRDDRRAVQGKDVTSYATFRGFDHHDFENFLGEIERSDVALAMFSLLFPRLDALSFEAQLVNMQDNARVAYLNLVTRAGYLAAGSEDFHRILRSTSLYESRSAGDDLMIAQTANPYAIMRAIRAVQFDNPSLTRLSAEGLAYHKQTVNEDKGGPCMEAELTDSGVNLKMSNTPTIAHTYQLLTPAFATPHSLALNSTIVLRALRDICVERVKEFEQHSANVFELAACFVQRYVAFLADFRLTHGSIDGHVYKTLRGGKRIKMRQWYSEYTVIADNFAQLRDEVNRELIKEGLDPSEVNATKLNSASLLCDGEHVFDLAVFSQNVCALVSDLDRLYAELDHPSVGNNFTNRSYVYAFQSLAVKVDEAGGRSNNNSLRAAMRALHRDGNPCTTTHRDHLVNTLALKMSVCAITTIANFVTHSYGPFAMMADNINSTTWALTSCGLSIRQIGYDARQLRASRNLAQRALRYGGDDQELINALLSLFGLTATDDAYEEGLIVMNVRDAVDEDVEEDEGEDEEEEEDFDEEDDEEESDDDE